MTNVLNLALPPLRHRPDTWPEHQDPVSHTLYEEELLVEKQKPQASCELKSLLPSLPLHLLAASSVSLTVSLWPGRPLGEGGGGKGGEGRREEVERGGGD